MVIMIEQLKDIGEPVRKKDHEEKVSGRAVYIADMKLPDMQYAVMVRATIPTGRIQRIVLPEMEAEYTVVDYKDVPSVNRLKVIETEQQLFAQEEVRYIGEPILMIVGPDKKAAAQYASQVQITYEEMKAVLTLEEAEEALVTYQYKKGNPGEAFEKAALVMKETFYTGYQEQAYIEPQGMIAEAQEQRITVYGSMQCPYYVRDAVAYALGYEGSQVQIIQTTTGGGFGGKEDYPSMIACQAAVAAIKVHKPVKFVFDRREDMTVTPKRHPAKITYQAAVDENHKLIGIKADIKLDAGAYIGLSSVVLQRSAIIAGGIYTIDNMEVSAKAMMTNTVPNGAFRGFGAPQSYFAIEMLMNHIAQKLGEAPLSFKQKHFCRQGDKTATNGEYHHHVPLAELLEKTEELSEYSRKYAEYQKPQTGRYQKGIGISIFSHGCGFTGSAEKDILKAVVRLHKSTDDTVEILASNTDIGQGLKTTFSKIAAFVLDIPYEKVFVENPDTLRVPNSGPTVASRSLMIVGKLIERAAFRMKAKWEAGKELTIEEHYKHPEMIPWDLETFQGDAYPTYSYGINVVEVELDTLLATTTLTGVWGAFDVGRAIDTVIIQGQIEGGMLQGIGYGSMEKMESKDGGIYQNSFTDYMIPTAKDTVKFQTKLVDNLYGEGPFGAKGAGELTLIGTAPAYVAAVEQAARAKLYRIPVTPEGLMEVIAK